MQKRLSYVKLGIDALQLSFGGRITPAVFLLLSLRNALLVNYTRRRFAVLVLLYRAVELIV